MPFGVCVITIIMSFGIFFFLFRGGKYKLAVNASQLQPKTDCICFLKCPVEKVSKITDKIVILNTC